MSLSASSLPLKLAQTEVYATTLLEGMELNGGGIGLWARET